jgi:hypothetical protein
MEGQSITVGVEVDGAGGDATAHGIGDGHGDVEAVDEGHYIARWGLQFDCIVWKYAPS